MGVFRRTMSVTSLGLIRGETNASKRAKAAKASGKAAKVSAMADATRAAAVGELLKALADLARVQARQRREAGGV